MLLIQRRSFINQENLELRFFEGGEGVFKWRRTLWTLWRVKPSQIEQLCHTYASNITHICHMQITLNDVSQIDRQLYRTPTLNDTSQVCYIRVRKEKSDTSYSNTSHIGVIWSECSKQVCSAKVQAQTSNCHNSPTGCLF